MHGSTIFAAAILAAAGVALWAYKKLPRVTAVTIFLASALATIGITVWLDTLAGLTATGTGLTVLAVLLLLGGIGFWFEAIAKHKHHRIRTPVIAGVFGPALVLGIGEAGRLLRKASSSPGHAASALSAAVRHIRSGQAARNVPPDHRMVILAVGAAVIVALVMLALKFEGGKKGSSRGPLALPGPARRTALPSGRRR